MRCTLEYSLLFTQTELQTTYKVKGWRRLKANAPVQDDSQALELVSLPIEGPCWHRWYVFTRASPNFLTSDFFCIDAPALKVVI